MQEFKVLNVEVSQCKPKYERKCFDYDYEECDRQSTSRDVSFTVENEVASQTMTTKQICQNVRTCRIESKDVQKTKYTVERKCENIPYQRRECKTVSEPQQPLVTTRTVYDTTYKQDCRNIPKTVCSMSGCGASGCSNPSYPNVCSTTMTQSQNVCGQCNSQLSPSGTCANKCQQVETPVCSSGSCDSGPQYCCRTEYQQICSQVPVKVPRTIQVSIPRPDIMKPDCQFVTDEREQCRMERVPQTYTVQVKQCIPEMKQECVDVQIPDFTVTPSKKNVDVKVTDEKCDMQKTTKQHCANLNVGHECKQTQKTKRVPVTRSKCFDGPSKTQCAQIPYSVCSSTGGQQCKMVPKVVCQDTCAQTNECNQCSQFASSGGFGQCPSQTCPNFVPSPSSSQINVG